MEHIYSIPYHDFTRHQKYSCALKKAQKYQSRNCEVQFRLLLQILETPDPVDDREVTNVVDQTVDREIATVRIRLGRTERVVLKRTFSGMLDDLALLPKSVGNAMC